jgi:ABC-type multidrug transport system ATPase subunit
LLRVIQAFGLTSDSRKGLPPAVDDVSLEAPAGCVTALLGRAGAGKTTTLRLMLELQQGRGITYFRGRPLHRISHPSREVGVLLGDVPGHPARTVRGHLRMLCAAAGLPARRADEVLEVVGLASFREEPLGILSRGMDRRLGLACALLPDPHTLVLDNPADGLSAREGRWLHGMLRAHATQGGTVLFTTADPKEAARTADRVATLEHGTLVADQEAEDFARTRLRPRVAVRTPHAARLAALLTKEARTAHRSVEVVREDGNRLSVYGSTCADVGEAAFRHGILVHQLSEEVGDMGPGAAATPTVGVQSAKKQPRVAAAPMTVEQRRVPAAAPLAGRRELAQPRGLADPPGPDDAVSQGGVLPEPAGAAVTVTRVAEADGGVTTERERDTTGLDGACLTTVPDGASGSPGHGETDAIDLVGGGGAPSGGDVPLATGPLEKAVVATSESASDVPCAGSAPAGVRVGAAEEAPQTISGSVRAQPGKRAPAIGPGHRDPDRDSDRDPDRDPGLDRVLERGTTAHTRHSEPSVAVVRTDDTTTATSPGGVSAPGPHTSPRPSRVAGEPVRADASDRSPAGIRSSPARRFTSRPEDSPPSAEPRANPTAPPAAAQPSIPTPRPAEAVTLDASSPLLPRISVRPGSSPLRPLRYELRRASGVGTGFLISAAVLVLSALTALVMGGVGHTPQPRLMAAWPQQFPLPPAALGAGLLGALAFGDEFRHPALAADRGTVPRRLGLLTAKLIVAGATAVLLAFLTIGCDAEVLYVVYGRELTQVPGDWLLPAASWTGLVAGCACAGVLAAGLFRSTTAGLAAVVAVPVVVGPLLQTALRGAAWDPAGLPVRLRRTFLLQWPFGGDRYLVAAARVVAQPVAGALALSLAGLVCGYLLTVLRNRVR